MEMLRGIFGYKCKKCGTKLVRKEHLGTGKYWNLNGQVCMRCNAVICDSCYSDLAPKYKTSKTCPYCGGDFGGLIDSK